MNSQGVAIEYTNGMRGGIFLNPEDFPEDSTLMRDWNNPVTGGPSNLKSTVNKKNKILLNPSYWERSYYADLIINNDNAKLPQVGFSLQTIYKNAEATLDRFCQLAGYGMIHVYSHGWAWPKQESISEVYLMTGEIANEVSAQKYMEEIKGKTISVGEARTSAGWKNTYFITSDFIQNHNDFSKDTVLFYGGFCYSFLGSWPNLQQSFANGAYVGFNWFVRTNYNATWAATQDIFLCNTSQNVPYTIEDWMSSPGPPPRSYIEPTDQKLVKVHYTGDAALTLWKPEINLTLVIEPVAADGAPILVPGHTCAEYKLRGKITGQLPPQVYYYWDLGAETAQNLNQSGNEITCLWGLPGTYTVKFQVRKESNNEVIKEATTQVTNIPIFHHDEWNCTQGFHWDIIGAGVQNYVQSIEFKQYDFQNKEWIIIQSVNWGNSTLYGSFADQ